MLRRIDVHPYRALARIYDEIMSHVDYEQWAEFAIAILRDYGMAAPRAKPRLLECACGTGSLSLIAAQKGYAIEAFDSSSDMIEIARCKASVLAQPPEFAVRAFSDLRYSRRFDAALCLYDSVNYITKPELLRQFFAQVHCALKPDGLLLFDICTEMNSQLYFDRREESGTGDGFRFKRIMSFHALRRIQENRFEIQFDEEPDILYCERHLQKIYHDSEIRDILKVSNFELLEAVDEFSRDAAGASSFRIHYLTRKG